ncbi:MAG: FkbM family methyltransferase [Caldisphaera sp.]
MTDISFTIRYRIRIWELAIIKFPIAIKLFKNPLLDTMKIMFGKIPLSINFKDGHSFTSYDPFKFYDMRSLPYAEFVYSFGDKKVRIIHAERGEVEEVFINQAYSWLPVKDKVVLDIGANIGDSSIYFALNGAKHVYAFEVVPSTAKLCRENVVINNLGDRVTVFNVGIGKPRSIKISSRIKTDGSFQVHENMDGDSYVEIRSLQQIVDDLRINNAVMKIDCEGCEYEVINHSSIDSLKRFSHIIGEYHYGFDALKGPLKGSGFDFFFTKPAPFYSPANTPKELWTETFKAIRKPDK